MNSDPDMRPEYDFSKGKRGAVIPHLAKLQAEHSAGKVRITTDKGSDTAGNQGGTETGSLNNDNNLCCLKAGTPIQENRLFC